MALISLILIRLAIYDISGVGKMLFRRLGYQL